MEQPTPDGIENSCISAEPERKRKLVVDDEDNIDSLIRHLQGAMKIACGVKEELDRTKKENGELIGEVTRLTETIVKLEEKGAAMQTAFGLINVLSAPFVPENYQASAIAAVDNLLQQNNESTEHPTDLDSATQQ